jgi:chitinase
LCSQDIETCQKAGKTVLLSLGGEVGSYGFNTSSQAQTFAQTVWDVFGGGNSSTRPFGSATVDGFDLDIENDEILFYSDFISAIRNLSAKGNKPYYITGAPQCPFPSASMSPALNASPFDMVFIQFYNNPICNVNGSGFNYATWQDWARIAPNPNVKLFVGVPASPAAASTGYINSTALEKIIEEVGTQPNFGGIMMWDANFALGNVQNNVNYAQAAKDALVAFSDVQEVKSAASVVASATKSPTKAARWVVPTTLQTVTRVQTLGN